MPKEIAVINSQGVRVEFDGGNKALVDPETGEEYVLQNITKPYYGAKHFWKIYLMDFLAILGIIESKQLDVVAYIMENTSPYDNRFAGSVRAIAEKVGVSRDTVQRTLRKLLDCNFMTKTPTQSVYLVNPSVIMKGSEAKRRGLLVQYVQEKSAETLAEAAEMDALDEQMSIEDFQCQRSRVRT